jgi:hypothetical protein
MTQSQDKKTETSASLTPIQRAEDILRKMTIEEKAMQQRQTLETVSVCGKACEQWSRTKVDRLF